MLYTELTPNPSVLVRTSSRMSTLLGAISGLNIDLNSFTHGQHHTTKWLSYPERNGSRFRASPMPARRYMEEIGSAAMLATNKSAGETLEVNFRDYVTHTSPPSTSKAAHSGFETQRRHHQKSITGVSVVPQKGLLSSKKYFKKHIPFKTSNTKQTEVWKSRNIPLCIARNFLPVEIFSEIYF